MLILGFGLAGAKVASNEQATQEVIVKHRLSTFSELSAKISGAASGKLWCFRIVVLLICAGFSVLSARPAGATETIYYYNGVTVNSHGLDVASTFSGSFYYDPDGPVNGVSFSSDGTSARYSAITKLYAFSFTSGLLDGISYLDNSHINIKNHFNPLTSIYSQSIYVDTREDNDFVYGNFDYLYIEFFKSGYDPYTLDLPRSFDVNDYNFVIIAATKGNTSSFGQVNLFSTSPVPEPNTWCMMLSGFFLIGVAMRQMVSRANYLDTLARAYVAFGTFAGDRPDIRPST